MKTDGISIIPPIVPPDVITDMTIMAAPPTIPINVAISISTPLVHSYRFFCGIQ